MENRNILTLEEQEFFAKERQELLQLSEEDLQLAKKGDFKPIFQRYKLCYKTEKLVCKRLCSKVFELAKKSTVEEARIWLDVMELAKKQIFEKARLEDEYKLRLELTKINLQEVEKVAV